MSCVKATWKNGQIVPEEPVSWPEGCRLEVRTAMPAEFEFLTEEEQGDDPESIRRWIEELRALGPIPMTPEQEAAMLAWQEKAENFNREAVRRQMEEGIR
jgi:hypothetical protein